MLSHHLRKGQNRAVGRRGKGTKRGWDPVGIALGSHGLESRPSSEEAVAEPGLTCTHTSEPGGNTVFNNMDSPTPLPPAEIIDVNEKAALKSFGPFVAL